MMKPFFFWGLVSIFTIPSLRAADPTIDYVTTILPIIKTHCWKCHSKDEKVKGNLDLHPKEIYDQIGKYNAIRPGDPDESSVIERMRLDETSEDFMPRNGRPMKQEDIAAIAEWIERGAIVDAKNLTAEEKELLRGASEKKSGMAPVSEFVIWKDKQGRQIEARYMGMEGEGVKLVLRNGKSYTVPLSALDATSARQAQKMVE